MTKRRKPRLRSAVLAVTVLCGGTYVYYEYVADQSVAMPGVNDVTAADAQQQAALVDQEDQRIMQIRAGQASALEKGGAIAAEVRLPHYASSANGKTLVLPQRSAPYYVADLEHFGQQNFQRLRDGSYLLGVNVLVASGAKLVLQNATGPLTIRLRSIPGAFTSIVSFGGVVKINGSEQNPVRITSWNDQTEQPDTKVSDGRAYIRAIGGDFKMDHAEVSDLGFWSGRTGGIALTGTDRPDGTAEPAVPEPARRVLLPNGKTSTVTGDVDRVEVSGLGAVKNFEVPKADLVTGSIENSTITGDAYGVFVSESDQTQLTGDRIVGSLVDGVLMHRFARNATIQDTTVTGSRGDGFVLSRATQSVRITGCVSEHNGGNGFTLNGEPLANGPSASGESLEAFGNSSVTSSTAKDNGRYGVELLGGTNLAVQTSKIYGGQMGIVVRAGATGVQISGNQLTGQSRQGIMLRGGVVGAQVAGNLISDAPNGIYLRDSSALIRGNTVQSASLHGVTLTGETGGSELSGNTFSGAGLSALDLIRARGTVAATGNNVAGWHNTAGFWTEVRRIATPLNIVWASVFLLVIVSALRSRSIRTRFGWRRGTDPYAHQRELPIRQARRLERVQPAELQDSLSA